jgi:hypothetical protein
MAKGKKGLNVVREPLLSVVEGRRKKREDNRIKILYDIRQVFQSE